MYTRQSTANPTGFRPWQSRLGYYSRARFAVPTSNLSGLGAAQLPNFASFQRSRAWTSRDGRRAPVPRIYVPPELSRSRMALRAGLGSIADSDRLDRWSGGPIPVSLRNKLTQIDYSANGNGLAYRIDPATGGYEYYPMQTSPAPVLTANTYQPVAPAAFTPAGDPASSTGTTVIQAPLPGGGTITATVPNSNSPVQVQNQNAISAWLDEQMISGVPNKYLALGAAALLLLRNK